MKVKLSVENLDKFKLSCEANDVTVLESRQYGKKTIVIVQFKSVSQIYEVGKLEPSIDIEEMKQVNSVSEVGRPVSEITKELEVEPESNTGRETSEVKSKSKNK